MSATIDSSGITTGVDVDEVSVDSASAIGGEGAETEGVGGEAGKGGDSYEGDAADFLLSNPKYHDCFMNVGNPDCEKVERIGVTSIHLIAHSPVFRAMLENKQADLPIADINITDVSPDTFKSMLRFAYVGKLPQLTPIEAAALALCAYKYKIPRLVQKALKRVIPTSAQDVFPALVCVTFASFPDLQIQVCNIIQQETDMIVQQSDFLKLSEECIIFILQQDTLNINELELWKHVVRWAEHQSATISPAKSVRDCLAKILGHVRFLTLTIEEILECILPKKILTSEEFMDLTFAVTKKLPLESPLLCKIIEKRFKDSKMDKEDLISKAAVNVESKTNDVVNVLQNKLDTTLFVKIDLCQVSCSDELHYMKDCCKSFLKITSRKPVEIESLTCTGLFCSLSGANRCSGPCVEGNLVYNSICNIAFKKIVENVVVSEHMERISFASNFCSEFVFMLKQSQSLIVMPGETLTLMLEFERPHPVYRKTNRKYRSKDITVEVKDNSQVVYISYRSQE